MINEKIDLITKREKDTCTSMCTAALPTKTGSNLSFHGQING